MFLQVVSLTGDVSSRHLPVGELYSGNFSYSRVWFTWLGGVDFGADCLFLETPVEKRDRGFSLGRFSGTSHDLVDGSFASGARGKSSFETHSGSDRRHGGRPGESGLDGSHGEPGK